MVATSPFRRNDFDMAARTDADQLHDSRAVVSTKGSSAGGAAGDGLMAVAGRAPALPVDYSFFGNSILFTDRSYHPKSRSENAAMSSPADVPTANRWRVLSLESRKADEMRSLIERHGGIATVAPSMREIPLEENRAALEFGERLFAGKIDVVVFLTGVGASALMETLCTRWDRGEIVAALERCTIVVRGPKPTAVLRDWGLRIDHRAPEPNTWHELLSTLVEGVPLKGKTVAIQEYGKPSEDLYRELEQRGATVQAVPVYRWDLPEDTQPLRTAIQQTIEGRFDVILFTSAQQFHNVLTVAEETGSAQLWLQAASRCVVASIGPTATETLEAGGLSVDSEPSHPKMGPLVREALAAAGEILTRKG
jgi:uroporphyrinogen-III synthase